MSLKAIAVGLTERSIATARGKNVWTETQVARVLERLYLFLPDTPWCHRLRRKGWRTPLPVAVKKKTMP
jgi:hypothetical protein